MYNADPILREILENCSLRFNQDMYKLAVVQKRLVKEERTRVTIELLNNGINMSMQDDLSVIIRFLVLVGFGDYWEPQIKSKPINKITPTFIA